MTRNALILSETILKATHLTTFFRKENVTIKLTVITICLLLLFPYLLAGQNFTTQNEYQDQYVIKNWNNTNGLPQNSVLSITTDSTGFLWFGTEEGLVRFDGKNFKVYGESSISGLESYEFHDLETSAFGGIWASSEKEIVRIKDHRFHPIQIENLTSGLVQDIAEDSNGNLWVGTNIGKLFIVKSDTVRQPDHWSEHVSWPILKVEAMPPYIYVGTTQGLFKIHENTGTINPISRFKENQIRSIFVTENKGVWVGTAEEGLFHLTEKDTLQYSTDDGFRENTINDIAVSRNHEVWVATVSSGLYQLTNDTFIPLGKIENNIRNIYTTNQGIVWVGTSGSGLFQLKPSEIYTLKNWPELSSSTILPIFQHQDGSIWVGTAGEGLYEISGNSLRHYSRDDGLTNEIILSVYGTENYIYAGTVQGLNLIDIESKKIDTVFTTEDGLSSNLVQAVYESGNGTVWIATREGGIHKIINDRIQTLPVPADLENANFNSIYEASNGDFWLGTDGLGAIKVSDEEFVKQYTTQDGLSNDIVFNFLEDEDGSIWLATYNGLTVITGDSVKSFNSENGLNIAEAYSIVKDKTGHIWVSSNSGLHRLKSEELYAAKRNNNSSFSIQHYTKNNGMPNSETNGGIYPSAWVMQNQEIWFPTVEGVAIVDPENLTTREDSINIVFESLSFGGESISNKKNIQIPAGVSYIEADYTSIDFVNPFDVQYAYRIPEISDRWTNVGNQNTIYLALQQPGEYTLEVRAEKDGVQSNTATQLFTVQPFFYQTLWFKILALILLMGLGYMANQLRFKSKRSSELERMVDKRTSNLNKALNEKEVLLQEVHHRVKNNLAVVSSMLEIQQIYTDNHEVKKLLQDSTNRIRSMALIHESLYQTQSFSDIPLKKYFQTMIERIHEISDDSSQIDIKFNCPNINLNLNQAIPAALIINELLSNSLEHAFINQEHGQIVLSIEEKNQSISIILKDNGVGYPQHVVEQAENPSSYGFVIIKTLIRQLNANLEIWNDAGANFTFQFKKETVKGGASNLLEDDSTSSTSEERSD